MSKNPVTGRWQLSALPATETTYLGGLTFPALTTRPHMGPFNRVTDYKISDADEVYRQHDIGYGKELAAGRSPYTRWNKYDQQLMDAPSTGWPDYLAKAIFGAKRFFTYGLPYSKSTQLKSVDSVASSYPDVTDAVRYDRYGSWINYDTKARPRYGSWFNYDTSSIPGDRGIFPERVYYEKK